MDRSLSHGRGYWLLVCLAIAGATALQWPVLDVGYTLDDYAQAAMVEGYYPVPRAAWDLFTFSNGEPADTRALMDSGFYPWWSHPEVRLSMFRPLASGLIALDRTLFGDNARVQHFHSLLWWWGMLLAVAWLLGTLLPRPIALTAFLLFAIDQPHAITLGWLANRTSILSALFGTLALLAHIRLREAGPQGPRRWLGPCTALCLSLALAAGEYGLSMLGFFLAYEWLGRGDPLRARLRSWAWIAAPTALYLVARTLAHAGSRHSGIYLDPLASPNLFAEAFYQRYPVLIAEALLSVRSEYWSFGLPWTFPLVQAGHLDASWLASFEPWRRLHEAVGLLSLGLYAWALSIIGRRAHLLGAGHAVWLAVGALVAALPLPGSLPSSRLMLTPDIGISALLATLLWDRLSIASIARARGVGALRRTRAVVAVATLAGLHLWIAPLQTRHEVDLLTAFTPRVRKGVLMAPFDPARTGKQRAVLVATGDPTLMIYIRLIRRMYGLPATHSLWVMSGNRFPYTLERPSDHSLIVRYPPGVSMMSEPFEQMFRSRNAPIRKGDTFVVGGMRVDILEASKVGPTAMRFTFDRPLEDPSWLFLLPTPEGLRHFPLPAIGSVTPMPPPVTPLLL